MESSWSSLNPGGLGFNKLPEKSFRTLRKRFCSGLPGESSLSPDSLTDFLTTI